MEELEAARASGPTAPDQTIRKAVTVLFGLLVEQVGRGGAADLLHDKLIEAVLKRAGVEFIDENGGGAGVRLRKRR